jgi:hypothetical protein
MAPAAATGAKLKPYVSYAAAKSEATMPSRDDILAGPL